MTVPEIVQADPPDSGFLDCVGEVPGNGCDRERRFSSEQVRSGLFQERLEILVQPGVNSDPSGRLRFGRFQALLGRFLTGMDVKPSVLEIVLLEGNTLATAHPCPVQSIEEQSVQLVFHSLTELSSTGFLIN